MTDSPRNIARAKGQRTYMTDEPCARGHRAPRYVSSGNCSECAALVKQANKDRNWWRTSKKAERIRRLFDLPRPHCQENRS